MTCDETIDILMSEDASQTEKLKSHLAECRRCRSLQEVLSPLASTGESASEVVPDSYFEGSVPTAEALAVAEKAATSLQQRVQTSRSRTQKVIQQWKYMAAFAAGVAASLGGIAVLHSEPAPSVSDTATACLWSTEFNSQDSPSELVRSCVACHLATAH